MDSREKLDQLDRQWVGNKELHESVARRQTHSAVSWIANMMGFGLVILGVWMNGLGEDARLERLLHPWPVVSMMLGASLVLGSLVIMVRNARHIRNHNSARLKYETRRAELLQTIYGSDTEWGS